MAKVKFIRKETDKLLNEVPIEDGQFLTSKEGTAYVDFEEERVGIGGSPDSAMSNTSINSVQNKVVKEYIDVIIHALGLEDDTYQASQVYMINDMVVYNHTIYTCNTDKTTGEFDASKWDVVPIFEF